MQPTTPRAKGRQSDPNTPQRRSLYDLQKLIDEVFDEHNASASSSLVSTASGDVNSNNQAAGAGDQRTCKARDLLAIISAFETRRQLTLLEDEEKASMAAFTDQNPDLAVTSEQLVGLLALMTAQSNKNNLPSSPSPVAYDKQLPTPPPSDNELEVPNESRSRSSSNSSRSSSSRSSNMLTGSGTLDDSVDTTASIFDTEPPSFFPRSQSMPEGVRQQQQPQKKTVSSPPGTPIANMFQRSHTMQDLNVKAEGSSIPRPVSVQHARAKTHQQHTPLSASISARQRSSPLEAQQDNVLRRSRPAPPKSRRINSDKDRYGSMPSSSSSGSIASVAEGRRSRQSSDEFALSPRDFSPREDLTSPPFGSSLDAMPEEGDSSFEDIIAYQRSRKISSGSGRGDGREPSPLFDASPPPQMAQGVAMFPPRSPLLDDTSFHSVPISPHEMQQVADDFDVSHHRIMGRPVSMASLGTEAALTEQIQALEQEMARKSRDWEANQADSYARMLEMQAKIEELMSDAAQLRKNDKELKAKDKIRIDQLATSEAQAISFKEDRDKQKTAYLNMRKQFEEQCEETEKFRNFFRTKSEEMRGLEDNFQNVNSELAKVTRERNYFSEKAETALAEIAEMRKELEAADEQRSEILQLKETIDRLRLELDEARAQNRKVESSSLSRDASTSGSDSVPSTLSRNLGRELARRAAVEVDEQSALKEGEGEDMDTSYEEEEIVTTRRRVKRPTKTRSGTLTGEAKTLDVTDGKQFTTVEVCDVGVQAAQDEAELPQQISQRIGDLSNMSPQQRRALLANELSVDLDAVESYIRDREERAAIAAKVPDSAPPPYHDVPAARASMTSPLADLLPRDAHALLDLAVKSSGPFLLYTAFVFVTGLLVGSAGAPICHHAHTASCDSYGRWAAFNTLDFETHDYPGWKSNALFWLERWAWKGVALSRRVPT